MMGGAAGIGDFFSGIKAAARRILNYATYYQMKERAGTVGAGGLNPLLRELRAAAPELRIHLVGHSFGGRLVDRRGAGARRQRERGAGQPDPAAGRVLAQRLRRRISIRERDGFFREIVARARSPARS